jgi:tRNA (guanine-N7-)-methyltransferase
MIDIDLDRVTIPLEWPELFERHAATDVEIGSGKGRFLIERASVRPERNLLAVERAAKYHRMSCERAAKRGLRNVRIVRTTAEDLLFRLLPPAAVSDLFVLFPDPWPKTRHHKRRLFTPTVVDALAGVLEPGGRLLVKSDHAGYAQLIEQLLAACPLLNVIAPGPAFAELPSSGFERKYLADGRQIHCHAAERRR